MSGEREFHRGVPTAAFAGGEGDEGAGRTVMNKIYRCMDDLRRVESLYSVWMI